MQEHVGMFDFRGIKLIQHLEIKEAEKRFTMFMVFNVYLHSFGERFIIRFNCEFVSQCCNHFTLE